MNAFHLTGRLALATGGARGIGAAICERFAAADAHIVVADRDEALATRLREAGARADALALDVTDRARVAAACRTSSSTMPASYATPRRRR